MISYHGMFMKIYFLFVFAFFCCSLNFICNSAAQNEPLSKTVELQNKCNFALDKFLHEVSKYFKSNSDEDFDLVLNSLETLLNWSDELCKMFKNVETVSTSNVKLLICTRRNYKIALNIDVKQENKLLILSHIAVCDEQLIKYLQRFKIYISYNNPINKGIKL